MWECHGSADASKELDRLLELLGGDAGERAPLQHWMVVSVVGRVAIAGGRWSHWEEISRRG
jgi:hypothetical protein